MRRSLLAVIGTLILAGAAGRAHAAAYTVTTFDAPGASPFGILVGGINDLGQIVGASAPPTVNFAPSAYSGFVYSGGTFTPVNAPAGTAAGGTVPESINNLGQIAGRLNGDQYSNFGLLQIVGFTETNNVFTMLPANFDANGINDSGVVVGEIASAPFSVQGYSYYGNKLTPLPFIPTGINNSGAIVGDNSSIIHGPATSVVTRAVLDVAGVITPIVDPNAAVGQTFVSGISNSGLIMGENGQNVFVDDNGSFTEFTIPGDTGGVFPGGINNAGVVVGYFIGTDAVGYGFHGFIATPMAVAEPASVTLLGMALAALGLTIRRRKHG